MKYINKETKSIEENKSKRERVTIENKVFHIHKSEHMIIKINLLLPILNTACALA